MTVRISATLGGVSGALASSSVAPAPFLAVNRPPRRTSSIATTPLSDR